MIGNYKILTVKLILFSTLLGYLVKYFFGLEFGTFFPDFLFVLLIYFIVSNYKYEIFIFQKINFYNYFLLYLIIHGIFFSYQANLKNNFSISDLTDYRNFLRGFFIYFVITSVKFKNINKIIYNLIFALKIYTFLIFLF